MRFKIDEDTGTRIVGWVLPNNPSLSPRIRILVDGKQHKTIDADQFRPLLKEQGWHNTGICGFVLDDKTVPDLAKIVDLELRDDASNVMIFRRRPKQGLVEAKLFRLEPQIVPRASLNDVLAPHFHLTYIDLEHEGEETLTSILSIPFSNSLYLTGRIFFRAFENQIQNRGFKTAILLRDPFHELAERLLVLKLLATDTGGRAALFAGDIRKASRRFRDVELTSTESIRSALRAMDETARVVLAHPLTRLLACTAPTQGVNRSSLGTALAILSEFDVVCPSDSASRFLEMLGAALEISEPLQTQQKAGSHDSVVALAEVLQALPDAHAMIEYDLQLYRMIMDADARVRREDEELQRLQRREIASHSAE